MTTEKKPGKRRGRPPVIDRTPISMEDRFSFGMFSITEIAQFGNISEGKVRNDARAGKIELFKFGNLTKAHGPSVKKYFGYS